MGRCKRKRRVGGKWVGGKEREGSEEKEEKGRRKVGRRKRKRRVGEKWVGRKEREGSEVSG